MQHTLEGLLWFDDLSPELKDKARAQIIFIEKSANKTRRQLLKLKPLHTRINDTKHIRRELNGIKALVRINKEGLNYLDKHISLNFCEFDNNGQYYTFKPSGYRPYNLAF